MKVPKHFILRRYNNMTKYFQMTLYKFNSLKLEEKQAIVWGKCVFRQLYYR